MSFDEYLADPLRTSLVYATRGRNFVLTTMRLAAEGRRCVVNDRFGAPIRSRDIAEAAARLVKKAAPEHRDARETHDLAASGPALAHLE
jgi:dTDP-4-dehydrorhamnose reductase